MTATTIPTMTPSIAAPDPTDRAERRARGLRLAGAGGLGFATLVIIENVLRSKNPQLGAPVADVISYYRDQRVPASIGDSLYVLTVPCLLLFAEGLRRAYRGDPVGRAGVSGLYVLVASFGLVACFDIALNTTVNGAAVDPTSVSLLWTLHSAAFVLNAGILGGAFVLLGWAAGRSHPIPSWLRPVGVIGGVLMIIGSAAAVPAVEGSPIGLAALAGFIAWLVWVVSSSITMVRAD